MEIRFLTVIQVFLRYGSVSILFVLFSSLKSSGAVVANVTFGSCPDRSRIEIAYDLVDESTQPVKIVAFYSRDGGADGFPFEIRNATGDIGEGILPGPGRRIFWTSEGDVPEELLAIKVRTRHEITVRLPNFPQDAIPLTLIRIPAGSYLMGSTSAERGRFPREGPVREITIGHEFYMGKYEVTQAQWRALMGTNPSKDYGVGNDYPVYFVSWEHIRGEGGFLERLNRLGQGTFRLPSEAEWEYACRAGTTTRFYFGDSLGCADQCANCAAGVLPGNRSDYMFFCGNGTPTGTEIVGRRLPNPFGLYNMHGNVQEWCGDWYYPDYRKGPTDGSPHEQIPGQESIYRSLRGGNWQITGDYCRSASRSGYRPGGRSHLLGFRIVMTAR